MLLPWSKFSTLSICSSGIALKHHEGKAQLLSDIKFTGANASQLAEILSKHQALLEHQQVRVILSNTFVRYLILPWKNEVFGRKDWQSIAQHEFRKQYGTAADLWRVSISFSQYGQSVIAAAVDETLLAQLELSAKTLKFQLASIQPLLMTLLNKTNNPTQDWTLVAEPERILLCCAAHYEWQQIILDSPPDGLEYQHTEQLIHRNLLQTTVNAQPNKVNSYVSNALHNVWKNNNSTLQRLMMRSTSKQDHALWMAELSLKNTTSKINLDFSKNPQLNSNYWAWGLLAIAVLTMSFLYVQYQYTLENIQLLEAQALSKTASKPTLSVDPNIQDKLKLARQTQQQLDLPWMQMLRALESVKIANPNIIILGISPNKTRAEIKLTGQTAEFSDLTNFLDTLRTNSNFTDAVLISQHLEDDKVKLLYVFEINLGWRI